MVNYDNPIALMDGMNHFSLLIFTRAALDTTSRLCLLCVGLTHSGKRGSYVFLRVPGPFSLSDLSHVLALSQFYYNTHGN